MRRITSILLTCSLVAGAAVLCSEVLGPDTQAVERPENLLRALQAQRELVARHPGDAAAYNDLANLLVLAGDLESAEDAYRRAVELSPREPAFRYNLALLMQQRGAFNKAAEQYREVVDLEPGNAWAHFQLGVIYEVKDLPRRAIDSYGRALQLDASLAFPDVNPAVIESELLTEAMLRGYRRGLSVPQAPRVYREPGRITSLLIQVPEQGTAETLPEGLQEEPQGGPPAGAAAEGATAAPEAGRAEGESGGSGGRTLSSGDLGEGRVNQANPQGRAGYRPPGSRPGERRTVRTWRPPNQGQDAAPDAERRQEPSRRQGPGVLGVTAVPSPSQGGSGGQGGDGGAAGTPPPRRPGTGRRPPTGVGSTGRLEMVLDPGAPERPA